MSEQDHTPTPTARGMTAISNRSGREYMSKHEIELPDYHEPDILWINGTRYAPPPDDLTDLYRLAWMVRNATADCDCGDACCAACESRKLTETDSTCYMPGTPVGRFPAPDTHGHPSVEDWLASMAIYVDPTPKGWQVTLPNLTVIGLGKPFPEYLAARDAAVAWVEQQEQRDATDE